MKLIKTLLVTETQDFPVSDIGSMTIGQCVDEEITRMVRSYVQDHKNPVGYPVTKLQSIAIDLSEDDWANLILGSSPKNRFDKNRPTVEDADDAIENTYK